jgi:hypothetical protein
LCELDSEGGALRNEIMKVHYALLFICSCLFLGGCVTTGGGGKKSSGDAKSAKAPVKVTESLKQGLVAYYPFNGNAKDESGNGNHGTVHNAGLSAGHDGAPNSAYSFDGNEWIDVGSVVSRYDVITMSAWIKSANKHKVIISKRRAKELGDGLGAYLGIGDGFFTAGFNRHPINVGVSGGPKVVANDNSWHHATCVMDGTKLRLYADGVFLDETTYPAGETNSDMPFFIGKIQLPTHEDSTFTGTIDEVRIYERALPAAEVKALYDSEKPKGE